MIVDDPFQPTPSARRVTARVRKLHPRRIISTHTLRKEGDHSARRGSRPARLFQPTPSARRVTDLSGQDGQNSAISTHTLRKEGDDLRVLQRGRSKRISTHTLRKEGDSSNEEYRDAQINFNPHPPQGG